MTGTIALQGGGPFTANDDLDRRLLAAVGASRAVVLPTADAYERPEHLVATAMAWGERLGVEVEAAMVMRRPDAQDAAMAATIREATAVYLAGDSPMHLRSVLQDTAVFDAVQSVVAAGGLVVGVGQSAAALCDPMVDPRGGAFTLGLGLVPGLALVTEAEQWSPDRLHRTLKLANVTLAVMPTGSALVRTAGEWEQVGGVDLRGPLPT
jgi:cyanophycinase